MVRRTPAEKYPETSDEESNPDLYEQEHSEDDSKAQSEQASEYLSDTDGITSKNPDS